MIETSAFQRLDKNFQQIVASYCKINHRNDQLQLICDNDGTILSITANSDFENILSDRHAASHSSSTFFDQIEEILANTSGCVVRTEMRPSRGFARTLEEFGYNPEKGRMTIYPVFYASSFREIQNVTVELLPLAPCKKNSSYVSEESRSGIGSCLVEPHTGLILESNDHFRALVGLTEQTLSRSRFEDIGLNDILLLAALNVDRRCLFPAQLNNSQTARKLVLSESEKIDDRACIRMWFPEGTEPKHQTHGLTEKTSEALLTNWINKPSKVLICDDNELLLDTCSSILSWAGICYQIAKNGKEALTHLEKEDFDALLLDLNMPLLNGFDTARIIRKSAKSYSETPIIAMTATPPGKDTFGNQLQNFDAVLRKPFDIEDIRIALEEALSKKSAQNPKSSSHLPNSSTRGEEQVNKYQTTSFMRRYRDNHARMENLRQSILSTLHEVEESASRYHYQLKVEDLMVCLQRAQSMSQSIGANSLATEIGVVYDQYESMSKDKQEELFKQLIEQIRETQVFYNTVDWQEFIPEKSEELAHIAA